MAVTTTLSPSRVWWLAIRPATLAASVAPVLAGTAVAVHEGGARPWAGIAALVVAIAIQIGVNLANDYSDFVRGADTPQRVGPLRAAASGVIPPNHVRGAAIAAFGVAGTVGLVLSLATDWRLLFVGAACLLAGCGIGFLATAILILNNLRDIETDAEAGKRTLATRIGRGPTLVLLLIVVVAAFTIPLVIMFTRLAGVTIMAMHFGIPIASIPVRTAFATRSSPALVKALKRMAAAELAYAMLMTIGLLLS